MSARRAEAAGLAALALAAVALFALLPTYPNYDTAFHLVWAQELLDGRAPSFDAYAAPTQHPLFLALAAALVAAFGDGADRAMVLVAVLSLVAVAWATFRIGRASLGAWPGLAGAFFVGSSFALLLLAVRGYVDLPFLALVLWAGVLEAERGPRRGVGPMALLATAGLLRPEAWVLAALYWLWCAPAAGTRRRLVLGALVAAPPAVWAAVDLAVTGDPLHSLHATSELAGELGRKRGLRNVPGPFVTFLADALRPPVFVAALAGLALALRTRGPRRLAVPLGLLVGGAATFVATGAAGLSIIPRYLTVPAVALALFAGYALLGFTTLAAGHPLRRPWAALAAVLALGGLAFAAVRAPVVERLADELRFTRDSHRQLDALLSSEPVRRGRACGPVTFPTYRLVPEARRLLDARADAVRSRAEGPAGAGVAIVVRGSDKALRRFGRAAGVPRRTNRPPPGFARAAARGPFLAYVRCPR